MVDPEQDRMHIFVESEKATNETTEGESSKPINEELLIIIQRKLMRTREEGRALSENQLTFLNSACDAAKVIGCEIEINDVGLWGRIKRIREKNDTESIPRIEYNGKSLAGNPTVDQIIRYFANS